MLLLCSLLPSCEHLVTTLSLIREKDIMKVDEITMALLPHNQWKQNQAKDLYVKGN